MRALATTLALALTVAGCGGKTPSAAAPSIASGAGGRTPSTMSANPGSASPSLRRSAVQAVLAAGPGAFLKNLTVDEHPVFLQGKFHGFRIAALEGDAWQGVDLRPGDVVIRVNGFSIEHPEDAAEAFYSLRVASQLTVEYERDGEPREIRFGIVEDAPPDGGIRQN